jgi:hypothetical protein
MNDHYEDLLALAILSNKRHADAYSLCSGLSRKFKIINCSEIIKRIERLGYVSITYPQSPQLKFFALTPTGQKLLNDERLMLSSILKDSFPEEIHFITLLLGDEGNVSK